MRNGTEREVYGTIGRIDGAKENIAVPIGERYRHPDHDN
jgi:hypothetical protein